jgi:hypothetical protein
MSITTFKNEKILWQKGKYAVVEVDNERTGKRMIVVTDGLRTDYPIQYLDGAIAYGHPEWFPKHVKNAVEKAYSKTPMFKCMGKDCPYMVSESGFEKHIKTYHPNFYNLVKEAHKGLTKKLNFKHLFEKVDKERQRA